MNSRAATISLVILVTINDDSRLAITSKWRVRSASQNTLDRLNARPGELLDSLVPEDSDRFSCSS